MVFTIPDKLSSLALGNREAIYNLLFRSAWQTLRDVIADEQGFDAAAFDDWLKPLEAITWVAYIEPPPTEHSTPEHVVKYLARYLTGGPISDRRCGSFEVLLSDLKSGTGFQPVVEALAGWKPTPLISRTILIVRFAQNYQKNRVLAHCG